MHATTEATILKLQAAERTLDFALSNCTLPLDTTQALTAAQWYLRRDLAQLTTYSEPAARAA